MEHTPLPAVRNLKVPDPTQFFMTPASVRSSGAELEMLSMSPDPSKSSLPARFLSAVNVRRFTGLI